jgi:RIO kinase 2
MRYLTKDDYRVLTAVEMGMRNHEMVPVSLITSIAQLRHGGSYKILSTLLRYKLVAHTLQEYDGYRLSYLGFDILALHALVARGIVTSVGNQIGVGKESDIFEAQDPEGNEIVIKIHRLGRTSFRAVRKNRDYMQGKSKASWLYMSRLAAIKEFAFMKALYAHGFPTPTPVDQNRHIVVMSRVHGFPMSQIKSGKLPHAEEIFKKCLIILRRLASHGLIHCDFNEFNIMLHETTSDVTLIDFPQMISTSHINAEEYLARDIHCLIKFFTMKMKYIPSEESYFTLRDVSKEELRIDEEVQASGFDGVDEDTLRSIHDTMHHTLLLQANEEGQEEGEQLGQVDAPEEESEKAAPVERGETVDGEGEGSEGPEGAVFDNQCKEKRYADAISKLRRYSGWLCRWHCVRGTKRLLVWCLYRSDIIRKGKGTKNHLKGRNATKQRNKYGKIVKADKLDY